MSDNRGFVGRCNIRGDRIDDKFHDNKGGEREKSLDYDEDDVEGCQSGCMGKNEPDGPEYGSLHGRNFAGD